MMGMSPKFYYDQSAPLDVREVSAKSDAGIITRNLTFATPFGYRRAAYLVQPDGKGPFAAMLCVHWLETWASTANRTQFLNEARLMAKRSVTSLLVETMWSDQDWFIKRTQHDDPANTVRQVIELRRAMDLLLGQPNVDLRRFAYVGHDFGAMYGVVTGSIDPRPTCYVLMAGAPRFSDWYLYYPELEGEQREAYVRSMAEFDPHTHVARLSPAPLLFQFARDDPYIPPEQAQAFYEAAGQPKEIRWYDAQHGLNELAAEERIVWLSEQLHVAES